MNFKIREAKLQDLKKIQDLNYKLFLHDFKSDSALFRKWPYSEEGKKYFKKAIAQNKYLCLVAELNNRVVGYLIGTILAKERYRPVKTAEIQNMLVLEKYRSKGVGKALVKRFVEWCKKKKVKSIVVWAYSKNKKVLKFYQTNDFKPLSVRFELKSKRNL